MWCLQLKSLLLSLRTWVRVSEPTQVQERANSWKWLLDLHPAGTPSKTETLKQMYESPLFFSFCWEIFKAWLEMRIIKSLLIISGDSFCFHPVNAVKLIAFLIYIYICGSIPRYLPKMNTVLYVTKLTFLISWLIQGLRHQNNGIFLRWQTVNNNHYFALCVGRKV